MLPLAMNWSFGKHPVSEVWVFWDMMGKDDYLFIPLTDDEMQEIITKYDKDKDIEPEIRLIIELSMLARSDPYFSPNALNTDKYDYTAENILMMEFPIDKDNVSNEEYFAAKMSQDVRRVRGWNTALIWKLTLPAEHFILMTGKLPSSFKRGSITAWDSEKIGIPSMWKTKKVELLEFSGLIMQAITLMKKELAESEV